MTAREQLLKSIADQPADDAPRLVFADWLEEHGDHADLAWSELIRMQIQLSRLPRGHENAWELVAKSEELERKYRATWLRDVSTIAVHTFVRGFPTRFGPRGGNYYDWQLKEEHFPPLEQALGLFPITGFCGRMLGCPLAEWQNNDTSYPRRGETGLEKLAAWHFLSRLESLEIGYHSVGETMGDNSAGLAALADSPYARNLKALDLSGLNLTNEDLFRLATSLPNLNSLSLWYNDNLHLSYRTLPTSLINTPLIHRLQRLEGVDPVTVVELLNFLGQDNLLRHLEVDFGSEEPGLLHCEDWEGAQWLQATGLKTLRNLRLRYTGPAEWQDRAPEHEEMLDLEGLSHLLGSSLLEELDMLCLEGFWLGDAEFRALLDAPVANQLIDLTVERCGLTGNSLPALRSLLANGQVRRLKLGWNFLKTEDAVEMASWPELRRLHELWLDFNDEIEEEGFDAIMESPYKHPWLYLSG